MTTKNTKLSHGSRFLNAGAKALLLVLLIGSSVIARPVHSQSTPTGSALIVVPFVDERSGKWGYRTASGSDLIAATYDEAGGFEHGVAPVLKDNRWYYIDASGATLFDKTFDHASSFIDGVAVVSTPDGVSYLDRAGRTLLDGKHYLEAYRPCHGIGTVKTARGWTYLALNIQGDFELQRRITELNENAIDWLKERQKERQKKADDGAKKAEADLFWEELRPPFVAQVQSRQMRRPSYDWGIQFVTVGKLDGTWLIHHDGTLRPFEVELPDAEPAAPDDLGTPDMGLIPFRLRDKWGVADCFGKIVVKPEFKEIGRYDPSLGAFTMIGAAGGAERLFIRFDLGTTVKANPKQAACKVAQVTLCSTPSGAEVYVVSRWDFEHNVEIRKSASGPGALLNEYRKNNTQCTYELDDRRYVIIFRWKPSGDAKWLVELRHLDVIGNRDCHVHVHFPKK